MDRLKDIFNNIKDRLTNPLVFSFICSWLIINWQITLGLFWLTSADLERLGYKSLIGFIISRIDSHYIFWVPFGLAIAYTVFMPVVKHAVRLLYSFINKWGDHFNFKIIKDGKIPVSKFLNMRDEYMKRTAILEQVITGESEYTNQFDQLKTENFKMQNALNESSQKLSEKEFYISQSMDIRILNGSWECNYETPDGSKGKDYIYIQNGQYLIVDSLGDRKHVFDITMFFYDNRNKRMSFVKELTEVEKQKRSRHEHFNIDILTFDGDNVLRGRENSTTKIAYTRNDLDEVRYYNKKNIGTI